MLINSNNLFNEQKEKFDVCVIGASAGGITFAREAARRGFETVLIDEGSLYDEAFQDKPFLKYMAKRVKNLGITYSMSKPYITIPRTTGFGGGVSRFNSLAKLDEKDFNNLIFKYNFPVSLKNRIYSAYDELCKEFNISEVKIDRRDPLIRNIENESHIVASSFPQNDISVHHSFQSTMLNKMVKNFTDGGGTLLEGTRISGLDIENGKILHISFEETQDLLYEHYPQNLSAKLFVLSQGAIESGVLLYKNLSKNIHNMTGKNLKLAPSTFLVGHFEEEVDSFGDELIKLYQLDYLLNEFGIIIERVKLPKILLSIILPGFYESGHDLLNKYSKKNIILRVKLIEKRSSGFVLPSPFENPFIKYRFDSEDFVSMKLGIEKAAELLFRSGAKNVILQGFNSEFTRSSDISKVLKSVNQLNLTSLEPVGTLRMAEGGDEAVVNANGFYSKLKNLIIADESILPAPLPVDPVLTIMALSLAFANLSLNKGRLP